MQEMVRLALPKSAIKGLTGGIVFPSMADPVVLDLDKDVIVSMLVDLAEIRRKIDTGELKDMRKEREDLDIAWGQRTDI